MGDVDFAEGFHLRFSFLLFFKEFALSGNITTVTFRGDVFPHGGDGFTSDDVAADRCLDGDDEHLRRDDFFELSGEFTAATLSFVDVDDGGEGFDGFAGDEHVHFDHFGGAVAGVLIVHGAVAFGHGFEAVVEVDEDVGKRDGSGEHDAEFVYGFGVFEVTAFFHDKLHDVADVVTGNHDEDTNDGLTDFFDDL